MKIGKLFVLVGLCLVSVISTADGNEISSGSKPPIAIPITLHKDGYVTLVVEDSQGTRVRNLVSETFFKAGRHTLYWNGMDDHGRQDVGAHGSYTATGSIVSPGTYRIRGLMRDKLDLVYEFSPYNPVNPPWRTADARGQWLADHTPPSSVLYVPGVKPRMLIGSSLAEGAHGLVWTDLSGKKIKGVPGIGAGWAGATRLCLDKASQPAQFVAYGLGASRFGEISLVGIGEKRNKTLYRQKEEIPHYKSHYIVDYPVGGLAVHNGLAAISFPEQNRIVFVKIDPQASQPAQKPLATIPFENPRGMVFEATGKLLVLSGSKLFRCVISADAENGVTLNDRQTVISEGLDAAQEIIVSDDGNIFISDHGQSHQVKVFTAAGEPRHVIGKPGKPACGPYDEQKMHHPMGMALTTQGELWVAEEDYQPKRVSIWTKDGTFKRAFYGPTEYGGGGKLDPQDKTRFYYFGMEFELDWETGTDSIKRIFYRRDNPANLPLPNMYGDLGGNPETPIYVSGRQYMTNTYTGNPTRGPVIAGVWLMDRGVAKPVAAIGQANYWDIFKGPQYKEKIPAGIDLNAPTNQQWQWDKVPPYEDALMFAWSDLNDNQKIEVEEVSFADGKVGSLNQNDSLSFITADGLLIGPGSFTKSGVPVYDLKHAKDACPLGVPIPSTTIVPGKNGDFAVTGSVDYFGPGEIQGCVCGITSDGNRWYYPSQWTGLHASQSYPINRIPENGDLIGVTKVIGPPLVVADGKEELWALNANSGQIYLFTTDGFFVASLFKHGYFADSNPPQAKRGMLMNNLTSDGEGFWQTVTATSDGNVYVQAMNHTSSIVRVDGLNSIERLEDFSFEVTKETLDECIAWYSKVEMARQRKAGKKTATIVIVPGPKRPADVPVVEFARIPQSRPQTRDQKAGILANPTTDGDLTAGILANPTTVDGDLSDWVDADWLRIDDRTEGAFQIADGRLFAAWKTLHRNLLENSGNDPWQGMFKTGGALDVMLSTSGNTTMHPKPGDQRLLASRVNGELRAVHYEQKSTRKGHPGQIASPNRSITFDYIADVSGQVRLGEGRVKVPFRDTNLVFRKGVEVRNGYAYEMSVPLELLGWNPGPGKVIGDIGVLLGNGTKTVKRLYWSNKNTTMLFDAPEESLLKPGLWGELHLVEQVDDTRSLAGAIKARGDTVEVLSGGIGLLNIDSSRLETGEPSAAISWSGEGHLSGRAIGRHGYIIFRHQAKGDWDAHQPLINLTEPFSFSVHNTGRFKDGLYAGCHGTRQSLAMFLDGQNCAGPTGLLGGQLWGKQKTVQTASWDMEVADRETHQMTIMLGHAAKQTLLISPLADLAQQRELVSFAGGEGMRVVQFSFTGSVRLTLEQPPYTDDEIKQNRAPANITAIFLD